jgi:NADH dehydrogenase
VAVDAVAAGFVGALAEPRSVRETYDLCGPEEFTLPEILRVILEVTGRRRWIVRVPMPPARLQAALLEFVFPVLLRQAPPLNRDQLLMLAEDNVGNAQPAVALFRLKQTSFRDGISTYLRGAA